MEYKLFDRDDTLLGVLTVVESDFPWRYCDFRPTNEFESFRPFFDWWDTIDPDDLDRQNEWLDEFFQLDLYLLDAGNSRVALFILHIDESRAWFRD